MLKNGTITKTQINGSHGDHNVMLQHLQPSLIFMKKNHVFLGSSVMSCSKRTKTLLGLSLEHN